MAQHIVYCVKLQKEAPGIDEDDIQGQVALEMIESIGGPEFRQRIYENVSMEAWELWKGFLTMIMNEYRLNTMDPEVDPFILQQMEDFSLVKARPATGLCAAPGQRLIRGTWGDRKDPCHACCAHFDVRDGAPAFWARLTGGLAAAGRCHCGVSGSVA